MSARLYGLVWKVQLSRPGAKLVLARLAENARDDGTKIHPAVRTVARETGLCRRTVQSNLKALQVAGLIEQVHAGGGRTKAAEYRINVACLHALVESGETVQILHPFGSGKGCSRRPKRVQLATKKGATIAPEPLRTLKEPLTASASAAAPDGAASARPTEHDAWDLMCPCASCQERLAAVAEPAAAVPATTDDPPLADDDTATRLGNEAALIHVRDGSCRFRQRLPRDLRRGQNDCLERSFGTPDLSVAWALRPRAMAIAETYFAKLHAGTSRSAADRWVGAAFAQLRRDVAPARSVQLDLDFDTAGEMGSSESVRA